MEFKIDFNSLKPSVEEHCITFDSDGFPNFFTVMHCKGLEDKLLGTIDGFCFSDNPMTNMYRFG